MRNEHLVFDCRMIQSSGIGRYIQEILPGVLRVWPKAVLLGNPEELLPIKYRFPGVRIRPFMVPIYSLKEQFLYRQKVASCDLFWSPHYNAPLLPIRAKRRIVTIHDAFHLAHYLDLPLQQKLYVRQVMHSAMAQSDFVITVSAFSRNELLRLLGQKYAPKIKVIYNGVSRMTYLSESNLPEEAAQPYFLFVGNIKPHKNLKNAILAFKSLILNTPKYAGIRFVIVGKRSGFITGNDGQLQELLARDPELASKIDFTGFVTDRQLGRLYAQAVALVFPSLYEGFGLPPLEAMALNCPAIVANTACMPEVCGEACLYVDPLNPEDISNQMRNILAEPALRDHLITLGEEQLKKYSWEHSTLQHISLFEQTLNL